MQKIVALVGPTASGKTKLSLALARLLNAEIVNADIGLFYEDLSIGTAKPDSTSMALVKHHMVNFLKIGEEFGLAKYLEKTTTSIFDILSRGKLPLVVGGSGQYVWGLLEGWVVPEVAPNPKLREELEFVLKTKGVEELSERLKKISLHEYENTDTNNPRRIIRAIERLSGGYKRGVRKKKEIFKPLTIGIKIGRDDLHKRVSLRTDKMFDDGLVEEVKKLSLEGNLNAQNCPPLIGYKEVLEHLSGRVNLEDTKSAINHSTSRLIRHQHNWFKPDDTRIKWFAFDTKNLAEVVANTVKNFVVS